MNRDLADTSYRVAPEERGYYDLSIAVIRLAVEDYRFQKRISLKYKGRGSSQLDELRSFFLSGFFETLSGVASPTDFLKLLDREIEEEYSSGDAPKRTNSRRNFR